MRIVLFILLFVMTAQAQILKPHGFSMDLNAESSGSYFLGNGVVDILTRDSLVWAATGFGLNKTTDGGLTWEVFNAGDYDSKGGVSALTMMDDSTLWIATAFDTSTDQGTLPAGGGLSFTRDFGKTWRHIRQPVDARDETEYSPTTTVIQNLTYDIAVHDSVIWITSFGGGIRKASLNFMNHPDSLPRWNVVTTDGLPFSAFDHLNHRGFSVISENGNIWIGTAHGISKSSDNGQTWRRFTHQNQQYPVSGNFIVAMAHQEYNNTIWAATIEATDTSEVRALSKTSNGGETWEVLLPGIFAHNFAFNDSIVYVASDEGAYISNDNGENWYVLPPVTDNITGEQLLTQTFYSAGVSRENGVKRIWFGSDDGLASTADNGNTWRVTRSYQSTRRKSIADVYAYPSPFSPSRHGYIRFQYDITRAGEIIINIYDFAMDKVATIREIESTPIGNSFDRSATWDGKNLRGDVVANGVYFFRVKVEEKVVWGKLIVIN